MIEVLVAMLGPFVFILPVVGRSGAIKASLCSLSTGSVFGPWAWTVGTEIQKMMRPKAVKRTGISFFVTCVIALLPISALNLTAFILADGDVQIYDGNDQVVVTFRAKCANDREEAGLPFWDRITDQ